MNNKKEQNEQLILSGVIGSITISKGNNPKNIQVTSKSDFFSEPIVYKIEDGCIVLRHSTIDDNVKKVSPTLDKRSNFYHFNIPFNDEEIPLKKYDFDEDSNEDEVIVYYL